MTLTDRWADTDWLTDWRTDRRTDGPANKQRTQIFIPDFWLQVKTQKEELSVSSCSLLAYQCKKAWNLRGLRQLLKTFEVMQSLLHLSHGCNVMQVVPAERKNTKEMEYLNEKLSATNFFKVFSYLCMVVTYLLFRKEHLYYFLIGSV